MEVYPCCLFYVIVCAYNVLLGGGIRFGVINILRTFWFNFRYLPLKVACKFPVVVYNKVEVVGLKRGDLIIESPGFNRLSLGGFGYDNYTYRRAGYLSVKGRIVIKGSGFHYIRPGFSINIAPNAMLEIGNNFSAANDLKLTCTNRIVIGNDNMWSYNCILLDSDIHQITDTQGNVINKKGEIKFGDHVWMGCRCTVLKNISVAHDVIIGSGTLVRKSLDDSASIYAGPNNRCI